MMAVSCASVAMAMSLVVNIDNAVRNNGYGLYGVFQVAINFRYKNGMTF